MGTHGGELHTHITQRQRLVEGIVALVFAVALIALTLTIADHLLVRIVIGIAAVAALTIPIMHLVSGIRHAQRRRGTRPSDR